MNQPYFIVVLAHSLHGRLRRIHIPHQVLYAVLGLALLGCFSLVGFVSSYARMLWKVGNYNSLRAETNSLRVRYQKLQKVHDQTTQQLATLQLFASEVSTAFGIKQKMEGPNDIASEGRLVPTFNETLEQYNFLKSANFSKFNRTYARVWLTNMRPSIWPVDGRLIGAFGRRSDPFSGEPAFHAGVDDFSALRCVDSGPRRMELCTCRIRRRVRKLVVVDHVRRREYLLRALVANRCDRWAGSPPG